MSLKMLSRFQKFDADRFFSGKKFLLTKIELWQESSNSSSSNNSQSSPSLRTVGTKVSGVIAIDDTIYSKDVKGVNEGETITFKVRKPIASFDNWQPLQTVFVAVAFDRVSIWGEYRNQLSVRVPDLKMVEN